MPGAHWIALICLLFATLPSAGADEARDLEPVYADFLSDADLLLSKKEKKTFLALTKPHQRDAFIERFWAARDPYPLTERNELRIQWMNRLEEARDRYRSQEDDRAKLFLLNGEPTRQVATDCSGRLRPLEVWYYDTGTSDRTRSLFYVVLYGTSPRAPFRVWQPSLGFAVLFLDPSPALRSLQGTRPEEQLRVALQEIASRCTRLDPVGKFLREAVQVITGFEGTAGYGALLATALTPPRAREGDWLADFTTTTTDLTPDALPLLGQVSWQAAGPDLGWEWVDGVVDIRTPELEEAVDGRYRLEVFGELFRDDRLFESFQYRFELDPEDLAGDSLPLVFRRRLRPGTYEAVLRVVDEGSRRELRLTSPLDVEATVSVEDVEVAGRAQVGSGTFRLLPPDGESFTGPLRVEVAADLDGIAKVRFLLDGRPILVKTRPPYSVSVNLGSLPVPHTVAAEALDRSGELLASDLLEINAEPHRFAIRLEGEILGRPGGRSLWIVASVSVPEQERIERLEIYREDDLVTTLFQPPWTASAPLHGIESPDWIRAVAYLDDGRWLEQTALLEGDALQEHVDVQFVELLATVTDRQGRPVRGLAADRFQIFEEGVHQKLRRFEVVEDLPIQIALLLDDSASMRDRLPVARQAAQGFLTSVLRPSDRAAVFAFSYRPRRLAPFTRDAASLQRALGELAAEGETASSDAVIFALREFGGLQGQRALLLLSDGSDRTSRATFEDALDYARRSEVTIYTVGLDVAFSERLARSHLRKLAETTGGLSFFVREASELPAIYDEIEKDLRSRYLLAYQSTSTTPPDVFRPVDIRLDDEDLAVRASLGYYP